MNPQERQLVDELFERLAGLEQAPRDPDAQAAIAQGLRRAPNAVYALVQTVLLQDEALKQANAHIEQLEQALSEPQGQPQPPSGSFLDNMRDSLFGKAAGHGSVPSAGQSGGRPVWNSGQVLGSNPSQHDNTPAYGGSSQYGGPSQYGGASQPGYPPAPPPQTGGSFLGTAAAAAAGVVGGSLLLNSIRGMMGGGHQSFGGGLGGGLGGGRPWGGSSDSSLSRDAGVNDIGSGRFDDRRDASFDQAQADADQDQDQDQDDEDAADWQQADDGDYGDDDGGDMDYA